MRIPAAARHAFAVLMGLVCAFMYFMGNLPIRPQGMPLPLFLAAVAAVLFLVCRVLGPLSPGLMVSYCAPVSLIVLALLPGEGQAATKLEPLFAVWAGAVAAWLVTRAFALAVHHKSGGSE